LPCASWSTVIGVQSTDEHHRRINATNRATLLEVADALSESIPQWPSDSGDALRDSYSAKDRKASARTVVGGLDTGRLFNNRQRRVRVGGVDGDGLRARVDDQVHVFHLNRAHQHRVAEDQRAGE